MPQISLDSLIGNTGPSYPEQIAAPYREELIAAGFKQMLTPADVDAALKRNDDKIILVVVNSVCGCSARVSRPGAILSLFNKVVPDGLFTIFAGMEKEAVAHFRHHYLAGVTPSSPNICVFKNGELVHMLHRYQIESSSAGDIADQLITVYNENCEKGNDEKSVKDLQKFFIEKFGVDPLKPEDWA